MIFIGSDDQTGAVGRAQAVIASATTGGSAWCIPDRVVSGCEVRTCAKFDYTAGGANPGIVTITGDLGSLTLTPDASGHYGDQASVVVASGRLFTAGQNVHIHADGGDVPTFDGDLVAPAPITNTTAHSVTMSRTDPMVFTWTGGTGSVHARLDVSIDNLTTSVECVFDAASGTGTITPSLLSELPAGRLAVVFSSQEHLAIPTSAGAVTYEVRSSIAAWFATLQ